LLSGRSAPPSTAACSRACLERIEIGVGAQHEDAVELALLLDLVGINRKILLADGLEIPPSTGVADQRLVALGELARPD
jgi:hypothetical protein